MTEMKTYIQPTITVVQIQTGGRFMIMLSGPVKEVKGGDTYILFGDDIITTDEARVKQNNPSIWDNEW